MSNALFMVFLTTRDLISPVNLFKEYKPRHLMCKGYVAKADPLVSSFYYPRIKTVTASDHYSYRGTASFHILSKCLGYLFGSHKLTVKIHHPHDIAVLYLRKYKIAFLGKSRIYRKRVGAVRHFYHFHEAILGQTLLILVYT